MNKAVDLGPWALGQRKNKSGWNEKDRINEVVRRTSENKNPTSGVGGKLSAFFLISEPEFIPGILFVVGREYFLTLINRVSYKIQKNYYSHKNLHYQ